MIDDLALPADWLAPALVGHTRRIAGPAPALWEGESVAAGAVEIRRREFAFGRACAREALRSLGHPPTALPRRADRTPGFPPGVCGSLSHSTTVAVAVVGPADRFAAVGVDVEPDRPLAPELAAIVASGAERARAADGHALTSLFGAKEAAFKCWFNAGGARIAEFDEFELLLGSDGTIEVLRQPTPQVSLTGRWRRAHGHTWALVWSASDRRH